MIAAIRKKSATELAILLVFVVFFPAMLLLCLAMIHHPSSWWNSSSTSTAGAKISNEKRISVHPSLIKTRGDGRRNSGILSSIESQSTNNNNNHDDDGPLSFNVDPYRTHYVGWLPGHRGANEGVETIRLPNTGELRRVSWRVLSFGRPRALIINGTLTPEEAAAFIDTAKAELKRSEIISDASGHTEVQRIRTSSGMFLASPEQRKMTPNVNMRRICGAIGGVTEEHNAWMEPTQVLHYRPGETYHSHPDWYNPRDYINLARGGQRMWTCLTWLNEVEGAGGTTSFTNTRPVLVARPQKFSSLLFYDVTEDFIPDPFSVHAAEPPESGEKWVSVIWTHGKPYVESLPLEFYQQRR